MKSPKRRAQEIVSVCMHDPDINEEQNSELYRGCIELADELYLGQETCQHIFSIVMQSSHSYASGPVVADYPDRRA